MKPHWTIRPMRLLPARLALSTMAFAAPVEAGVQNSSLAWPSAQDKAICDGIFSALDRRERGVLMAQADAAPAQSEKKPTEAELASELSDLLQACSYDGKAFKLDPKALAGADGTDGAEAVRNIMRFTGLPQNFKVMEGEVPNAAAMVVMGADGIPERVIAYNVTFMQQVRDATEKNDWASVSIMAHEIGHHLSGHTLVPGGSQPPIELEADKFSGFVLFKMGAALPDAQKAIATLIPEEDGPTHPGRPKRLAAVEDGWTESCEQQGSGDCSGVVVVARVEPEPAKPADDAGSGPAAATSPAEAPAGAEPAAGAVSETLAGLSRTDLEQRLIELLGKLGEPGADIDAIGRQIELVNAALAGESKMAAAPKPDIPGPADIKMPDLEGGSADVVAGLDRVPKLDATATPSKFDRFVYDDVGVFDVEVKAKLAKTAYDYAASNNIEIVTIVTRDLQGRSAEQFALDAMRQLRVGKLEVGNGAVLVVAPEAKEIGVALGAGLLVEYDDTQPLESYLESFLDLIEGGSRATAASELIAEASYRIMRDTKSWEWVVRYQSLADMLATAEKAREELERTGAKYDPATDPTWRKLARVRATIVSKAPDKTDKLLDINEIKEGNVGPAMHVRTADGKNAVLYVNPNVSALMPVTLEEGKIYAFVVRDSFLAGDTPQFDLISYDLVE